MLTRQTIEKLARGAGLSEIEAREYGLEWERDHAAANTVRKYIEAGTTNIKFPLPVEPIFVETLVDDAASITINLPSTFRHLLILGSGRTTGAGTSADFLLAQYNEDTGNNYINQKLYAINTSLTAARDVSQNDAIIGLLSQGGHPAGNVSSFLTFIPNCVSSTLNKNSLTLASPHFGSFYGFAPNWDSLDPIESIQIYSGADSIAAGSSISVYGIV